MIDMEHPLNSLPWLDLFDELLQCNVFLIQDYIQFEKQVFVNREKLKV